MNSGEAWRLGHRPGLDGLRGVAVLMVIAAHFGIPGFANLAQPGVTAFFVLSGFLITALLLEERERIGRVDLRRFYLRRLMRLGPALLACVVLISGFAVAVGASIEGALPAVTYVMNFVQASGEHYQAGLFGHTWSLGIEEQFYLLWPLCLLLLARISDRRLPLVIACAAAGVTTWRVVLEATGAPPARTAYGLDTRSDALLAGCALAAYLHSGCARRKGLRFGGILESRGLTLIGRRSYGLYLWHYPIVALLLQADPVMPWWERTLIGGPIVVVVVAASWRYVEAPCLRMRPPSLSGVARPPGELPSRARVHGASPARRDAHVQPELDLA